MLVMLLRLRGGMIIDVVTVIPARAYNYNVIECESRYFFTPLLPTLAQELITLLLTEHILSAS